MACPLRYHYLAVGLNWRRPAGVIAQWSEKENFMADMEEAHTTTGTGG